MVKKTIALLLFFCIVGCESEHRVLNTYGPCNIVTIGQKSKTVLSASLYGSFFFGCGQIVGKSTTYEELRFRCVLPDNTIQYVHLPLDRIRIRITTDAVPTALFTLAWWVGTNHNDIANHLSDLTAVHSVLITMDQDMYNSIDCVGNN